MDQARLLEIQQITDRATPGPWEWHGFASPAGPAITAPTGPAITDWYAEVQMDRDAPLVGTADSNGMFIAAARTVVPELLADNARLQEEALAAEKKAAEVGAQLSKVLDFIGSFAYARDEGVLDIYLERLDRFAESENTALDEEERKLLEDQNAV